MAEPLVLVERGGAIARLTLNRPAKLNALDSPLIEAAGRAVADLDGEDGPKVIILRGAGRAFVAGADLREMRDLDAGSARAFITRLHGLFAAIRAATPLVVAQVHGPALGAGCELVAVCDLRVAGEGATFGMPEIAVGMPSVIDAAVLVPLIGLGHTQQLVYTGEAIDAATAARIGLVNQAVPDGALAATTEALAARLAGFSRRALALQKALVRRWHYDDTLDRAVKLGIDHYAEAFESSDPRRAIDATLDRRAMRFED